MAILPKKDKIILARFLMQTFGEFIRELRKQSQLTLTQLAAQLEMDSANLSRIENGKRDLDERKLQLLANLFKLNINELKTEYYSEKFARKIFEVECSESTLIVAEQKVKYYKEKNTRQGKLSL